MTLRGGPALAAGAVALAGYALLSHQLMVHAADRAWTVALLFGPLVLGLAATGWHRRHVPTLAGATALAALLALVVARGGITDTQRLYVAQHAALHALLAWAFGSTLRRGATPLITALAERVHRRFTDEMRRYTGRLTAVWTAYFVAMIPLSLAIYALAPWPWWSAYCNLVTPAAAALLFVGEHAWRYWRHPHFERLSLAGGWQAWREFDRAGRTTPAERARRDAAGTLR